MHESNVGLALCVRSESELTLVPVSVYRGRIRSPFVVRNEQGIFYRELIPFRTRSVPARFCLRANSSKSSRESILNHLALVGKLLSKWRGLPGQAKLLNRGRLHAFARPTRTLVGRLRLRGLNLLDFLAYYFLGLELEVTREKLTDLVLSDRESEDCSRDPITTLLVDPHTPTLSSVRQVQSITEEAADRARIYVAKRLAKQSALQRH